MSERDWGEWAIARTLGEIVRVLAAQERVVDLARELLTEDRVPQGFFAHTSQAIAAVDRLLEQPPRSR
jgi:hypothetical protein